MYINKLHKYNLIKNANSTLLVKFWIWFKSSPSSCLIEPIAMSKWILNVGLPWNQDEVVLVDKQTVWSPAKCDVNTKVPTDGPLLLTTACFSSVSYSFQNAKLTYN